MRNRRGVRRDTRTTCASMFWFRQACSKRARMIASPLSRCARVSTQTGKSGAVVNAEFLDSSYKVPGGGWLSSAPDMGGFEVAILTDRLIRRATRDIMWMPKMPLDGLGRMVYGLGWQAGTTQGVGDVGHGGSQQGTSVIILIAPDARAGVVVLINSDAAGASEFLQHLRRWAGFRPRCMPRWGGKRPTCFLYTQLVGSCSRRCAQRHKRGASRRRS